MDIIDLKEIQDSHRYYIVYIKQYLKNGRPFKIHSSNIYINISTSSIFIYIPNKNKNSSSTYKKVFLDILIDPYNFISIGNNSKSLPSIIYK